MNITQDSINGYLQALQLIENYIENRKNNLEDEVRETCIFNEDEASIVFEEMKQLQNHIDTVKDNYKQLIKELNERQS